MKKLLLIPTAIVATTAPIISLVGCNGSETPEPPPVPPVPPVVRTIEISGLEESYDGYYYVEGHTNSLTIQLHDGELTKDITDNADIFIDCPGFGWDKTKKWIYWTKHAIEGEHKLKIIASYDGVRSEASTTTVNLQLEGTCVVREVWHQYTIKDGTEGATDVPKVVIASPHFSDIDVTEYATFNFSQDFPDGMHWDEDTHQIIWGKDVDISTTDPFCITMGVDIKGLPFPTEGFQIVFEKTSEDRW